MNEKQSVDIRNMIDIEDLNDLALLKSNLIYEDDFEELPKERQEEIYLYCKAHCQHIYCKKNLITINRAVAKIYFGY